MDSQRNRRDQAVGDDFAMCFRPRTHGPSPARIIGAAIMDEVKPTAENTRMFLFLFSIYEYCPPCTRILHD